MSRRSPAWLLLPALLLSPSKARAGGYEIGEQSGSANAMAGAFVAKADDPSAIFYNPAGLAQLDGLHVYVGTTLVITRSTASDPTRIPGGSTETDLLVSPLPNFYGAYGFGHGITVGLGIFTHYGLQIHWPDDWAGNFLVTKAQLRTADIAPTIAWQPVPYFSVGASFDLVPASADLQQVLPLGESQATLRFRANDAGVGGSFGLLVRTPKYKWVPPFRIGFSYRSRIDLEFDGGRLNFIAPIELSGALHDVRASTKLPLPGRLAVGVGVRPVDRVFLQVEFDWVQWSKFQTLTLTAEGGSLPALTIPQNWGQGYTLRAGGEVVVGRTRLRAGLAYDWAPSPASTLGPLLPDASRWLFSTGVGIDLPAHLVLDVAVLVALLPERRSELPVFPVQYSTWAVLPTIGISRRGEVRPRPSAQ